MPAGTACPPDLRQTAAFRRIPRERRIIRLTHHTPQYLDTYRGAASAQRDTYTASLSLTPTAQVLNILAHGPATRAKIAGLLPRDASVRDILYRLAKKKQITLMPDNTYSLAH